MAQVSLGKNTNYKPINYLIPKLKIPNIFNVNSSKKYSLN